MYNNLFDGLVDELAQGFSTSLNNTVKSAEKAVEKATVDYPMNVFKEEDGSYGVEVAVVGKTKDDLTLSSRTESGKTWLIIKDKEPEKKEEAEKTESAEDKRVYSVKKIKSGKLNLEIGLPSTLDFAKLNAKVANGLLKISIPVAEALKPIQFTID